jgi:hypothetical protein
MLKNRTAVIPRMTESGEYLEREMDNPQGIYDVIGIECKGGAG